MTDANIIPSTPRLILLTPCTAAPVLSGVSVPLAAGPPVALPLAPVFLALDVGVDVAVAELVPLQKIWFGMMPPF